MLINGKTYSEIGKNLGLSKQRAQQLVCLTKGERAKFLEEHGEFCDRCGELVGQSGHIHHKKAKISFNGWANLELLCIACHRHIHKKDNGNCPVCGTSLQRPNAHHCSSECWSKASQVKKICTVCGVEFTRCRSLVEARYKHKKHWTNRTDSYFCSKQCQGLWLSQNYGFGSHPEFV